MTLKQLKPENCRLVRNILVSNAFRTVRELDEKCAVATDCSRAVNRKTESERMPLHTLLYYVLPVNFFAQKRRGELIMLRYFRNWTLAQSE